MKNLNGTLPVLIVYAVCLIVGQAMAVGVGLLIDPYSKTAALATFIPLYYLMYWVAWRIALAIADRPAQTSQSGVTAAMLLAPAVLALDFCD